ncbi:MAG: ABC transporter substrate-binding protein [Dehalococcoidia bacterium]|nr:ABC transporter substrate-binding protein [Dehalococcoidia bacterium]
MNRLRKTGALVLALITLVVLLTAACAPASTPAPASTQSAAPAAKAPSGDPYKVGFVNSFSGYMAAMGALTRETINLLEPKINADGGINGRPLKIITYDDESDETKGVLAIKKLIEADQVHAIVGMNASGVVLATVPTMQQAQIPYVSVAATRDMLKPPSDWIFKLPNSEGFIIEGWYRYAAKQGWKKLALMTPDSGWGKAAKAYLENTVQQHGITIVANETYGPTDTDMRAQLTKIKGAGADVLLVGGAEPAGAMAISQAKGLDFKIPSTGFHSITMPAIMSVKELSDGLEGLIFTGHKPTVYRDLPDSDRMKKGIVQLASMLTSSSKRDITAFDGFASDSLMLVVDALKRANPDPTKVVDTRKAIKTALEQTKDFVGVSNIVNYTPTDHEGMNLEAGIVAQVKGGAFKLITTLDALK